MKADKYLVTGMDEFGNKYAHYYYTHCKSDAIDLFLQEYPRYCKKVWAKLSYGKWR